jgi:hypothetical protein
MLSGREREVGRIRVAVVLPSSILRKYGDIPSSNMLGDSQDDQSLCLGNSVGAEKHSGGERGRIDVLSFSLLISKTVHLKHFLPQNKLQYRYIANRYSLHYGILHFPCASFKSFCPFMTHP